MKQDMYIRSYSVGFMQDKSLTEMQLELKRSSQFYDNLEGIPEVGLSLILPTEEAVGLIKKFQDNQTLTITIE